MPVPTHSEDCRTSIFPTRCPDCQEEVYFFSCTCGSKVFFDLNQPPWNPHEDRCIHYLVRYMRETEHVPEATILSIVQQYSRESGIPIPQDILRTLQQLVGTVDRKLRIIEVKPDEGPRPVVGTIIEINTQVNFLNRFKFEDNSMGRSLLGKLLKNTFVEVIVREDPDQNYQCGQFTIYVKLAYLQTNNLLRRIRISGTIEPYQVPGREKIWLSDTIKRVHH